MTMRSRAQPRCPNCGEDGVDAHRDLRDKVYGAPGAWRMRRCTHADCGVFWLDPEPHPDDLGVAYADYHTHGSTDVAPSRMARVGEAYAARRLGLPSRGTRGDRLASLLLGLFPNRAESALYAHFYLSSRARGSVLEVGCGAGEHLATLARDGWRVRGVDFDAQAVAVARRRGLDVAVGDVRELGLPAASFDAVVMAQLIEHVYDPPGLVAECARLLAPGGRLVAMTPNAGSLGHRLYGRDWRGLEPPRHLVVFTAKALRRTCERAGLVVERLDATARDAANLFVASERIRAAADGASIERPREGVKPPLRLRALAAVESFGRLIGLGWGEELVLIARKPAR